MNAPLRTSTAAQTLPPSRTALLRRVQRVREHSVRLAAPLSAEDQVLQAMPDASPTKWHLAHTTWFFETLVLAPHASGHHPYDARWGRLFNSYYESLGARHPRAQRGLLSRPSQEEVHRYREHVDKALARLILDAPESTWPLIEPLVELGLAHEEQHQELILTDILCALACNPLEPAYEAPGHAAVAMPYDAGPASSRSGPAAEAPGGDAGGAWHPHPGGIVEIGHTGCGFAFDNEMPAHAVLLHPFEIAAQPVSCGEWLAFMEDGGYARPELWLSDGWAAVQAHGWEAPMYWARAGGAWTRYGLQGRQVVDPHEPVCHVSLYEACAFAEWAGARLPGEFEWEAWARALPDDRRRAAGMGQVWEWTRSSYAPYPGFRPLQGTASEYNGKFMVGQYVLRGGSRHSPQGHVRTSYRNYFPPQARWQFSGLRLARDAAAGQAGAPRAFTGPTRNAAAGQAGAPRAFTGDTR